MTVLLLVLAVAIPLVLVSLVLLRDRYLPWMKRHETAIWIAVGAGEVAVAAAYLIRGVTGWGGWLRVAWSVILAAYFLWQSSNSRRELARKPGS
ncbi:MAG: hypothetical protein M3167_08140 [Acidobacteriota bacterium]|nr:hypothetical protein [Acidobacteriota bacterium]